MQEAKQHVYDKVRDQFEKGNAQYRKVEQQLKVYLREYNMIRYDMSRSSGIV